MKETVKLRTRTSKQAYLLNSQIISGFTDFRRDKHIALFTWPKMGLFCSHKSALLLSQQEIYWKKKNILTGEEKKNVHLSSNTRR